MNDLTDKIAIPNDIPGEYSTSGAHKRNLHTYLLFLCYCDVHFTFNTGKIELIYVIKTCYNVI